MTEGIFVPLEVEKRMSGFLARNNPISGSQAVPTLEAFSE
jgi:hypothetical protein